MTAKSVLEAEVQRAAVAPFDGFIRAAPVRAGDTVRAAISWPRLMTATSFWTA